MQFTLLPEWAEQDAVMLTWPHSDTDWSDILDKVEPVYIALCQQISQVEDVVIVAHDESLKAHISNLLKSYEVDLTKVHFVVTPCNDTWARDHGPITTQNAEGKLSIKDFSFTGWGNKFAAEAVEMGAVAVVVDEPVQDLPCLLVEDTRKAYGQLAAAHRDRRSFALIALWRRRRISWWRWRQWRRLRR